MQNLQKMHIFKPHGGQSEHTVCRTMRLMSELFLLLNHGKQRALNHSHSKTKGKTPTAVGLSFQKRGLSYERHKRWTSREEGDRRRRG